MSAVEAILESIQRLSREERAELEQRLADLAEAEWKREAQAARAVARARGIDQAAIDKAVHDLRHGS